MENRASITVFLGRLIQKLPFWLFHFLERPLVALYSNFRSEPQAIFVLALPRSGSTLTYQLICHGLSVNYLSNFWNLFYQLPLFGGWLSAKRVKFYRSNFRSENGFVPGIDGPAEGLRFWQWWLDCGLSDRECENLPVGKRNKRSRYLRRVFAALDRYEDPFITTYLGHVLVSDRVNEAFPGAILIRLKRDPISNALSILKLMRTNDAIWFSVLPKECEGLEYLNEHERVAAQVYWLNRRLDDANCSNKMLVIHYEKLCSSPESELARIRDWCCENGVRVEPKFKIPQSFEYKSACIYTDKDAIKIKKALDILENEHGKLKPLE